MWIVEGDDPDLIEKPVFRCRETFPRRLLISNALSARPPAPARPPAVAPSASAESPKGRERQKNGRIYFPKRALRAFSLPPQSRPPEQSLFVLW